MVGFIEQCGLMDMGSTGMFFTWTKKVNGVIKITKHLDRTLADCEWRNRFPEAFVENLIRHHFDHHPMLMTCKGEIPQKINRPFRFQAAWLTHKQFPWVVHNAWIKGNYMVTASLGNVQKDAQEFNSKVFGNIFNRKRTLEARMKQVQRTLEHSDIPNLAMLETELQRVYNEVLKQEELLWYQKSREKWVRFRDRNTKFFHTQTIVRRRRNKIQGMFIEDGSWNTDPDVLKHEATSFFKNLFTNDSTIDLSALQVPFAPKIKQEDVEMLIGPVTLQEVHKAVFSMKSYKAPGPDGF